MKTHNTELAEIRVIPIEEFLRMEMAPGHRDSEGRAHRAKHLHRFVPEHLNVECAEYPTDDGKLKLVRMTGNTRASVWKCGLSDVVPSEVQARVFKMKDAKEVTLRMLRHDAPEAA